MKFKVKQIIVTDDAGFLVLKGVLPEGTIEWCRNIKGDVYVKLEDHVNLEWLEKTLNSISRTLNT